MRTKGIYCIHARPEVPLWPLFVATEAKPRESVYFMSWSGVFVSCGWRGGGGEEFHIGYSRLVLRFRYLGPVNIIFILIYVFLTHSGIYQSNS